ncbi:hypothetical protein [Mesobacillus zeae]|uniref:Uncharacterized protein n=1 Tax=Mesobacillus zeae TaxID=1917180 RepID=A0A398BE87_9BACI|nr:hypothetical protein [Mesobacillus zeae]RID88535.1 hypothetical protein D1970_01605 [Mesobacillus zeae]
MEEKFTKWDKEKCIAELKRLYGDHGILNATAIHHLRGVAIVYLDFISNIKVNGNSLKVEEWEESCHGLKEKLQTDLEVDFEEYCTAKSLYKQWELLYGESQNYQEKVESDVRKKSPIHPFMGEDL